MVWYNPKTWFQEDLEEKENPAQALIAREQGLFIGTTTSITYQQAFEKLETVNRGTNMIVSACSSLDYDVKDKNIDAVVNNVRQKTLINLLNFKPNPYQSVQDFRTNIFTDFILEGNIFIYYDGVYLYHLPASRITIATDPITFVSAYRYNMVTDFKPQDIIHIKDLSDKSIYRGNSRLMSATRNINILYKMLSFQEQFFDNGAVPGLILTTDNTLSQIAKDKTIANWITKYSPKNGAKRPMILDSGLKVNPTVQSSFKDMDFDSSIATHDDKILKSLGIPPILLDGGNNANISPNLRLFYLETVMPILVKVCSAFERYFGYDVAAVTSDVSAMQPDITDIAMYLSTLTNGGIMTPNESRVRLRLPPDPDPASNTLRIPANITGSAVDSSQGGAPKKPANASTANNTPAAPAPKPKE